MLYSLFISKSLAIFAGFFALIFGAAAVEDVSRDRTQKIAFLERLKRQKRQSIEC